MEPFLGHQQQQAADGDGSTSTPDLCCPICLEIMLNNPTTLACGHSGCLLCMAQTFALAGSRCPVCRSPHRTPLSVNITLRQALGQLYAGVRPPQSLLPPQGEQAQQLRKAVSHDDETTLCNLLLAGFNPNSRLPPDGHNALAHAAQHGRVRLANILLNHGAKVNLQDSDGDTALMNAVYFRKSEMVRLFVAWGANPFLLSLTGLNALDYANRQGHLDAQIDESIVRCVEQAQNDWNAKGLEQGQGINEQADVDDDDEKRYSELPLIELEGGPRPMMVAVAAPLVRAGISPHSTPVGRLSMGQEILAVGYCFRGSVTMVKFENGPPACPEGWLPYHLQYSNTIVLEEVTEQAVESSNATTAHEETRLTNENRSGPAADGETTVE